MQTEMEEMLPPKLTKNLICLVYYVPIGHQDFLDDANPLLPDDRWGIVIMNSVTVVTSLQLSCRS